MDVFISPYHLGTREPAAMAGLLVARRVVTLIPAPMGATSKADLAAAALEIPRYRTLVDHLSWLMPLFQEGVIESHVDGLDALEDVREVWGRIESEQDWAPLRQWMQWSLPEEPIRFLDALCHDLMRGGPDPGISVPLAAGVDRFAARHALAVARSHPTSLAQRAEAAFAKPLVSWGMPMLLQAESGRIAFVREVLEEQLAALRDAIDGVIAGEGAVGEVRGAAARFAAAFAEQETDLLGDAGDEIRPIAGMATMSLVRLPVDAVLRSSADAAAAIGGARARRAHQPGPISAEGTGADSVLALMVKVLGRDGTRSMAPRRSRVS